jgi:hypothetical protein
MRKKYEIGNPSDKCFIYGDIETQKEALFAVVAILGSGSYFLVEIETNKSVFGGFLFGGFEEFWENEFGRCFSESITDRELIRHAAEIFESFEYARDRSSMNDIGARAKANAESFRKFLGEKGPQ